MKALTDRQKLNLYKKSLLSKLFWFDRNNKKWIPMFSIGARVKIINVGAICITHTKDQWSKEWEKCDKAWTWLDDCRLVKVGEVGIITNIRVLKTETLPHQITPYSYFVKFKDGSIINFYEPYLKRYR